MNLADSMELVFALFDAHLKRDMVARSRHRGSKRPGASKAMIRARRKAQRRARKRQR